MHSGTAKQTTAIDVFLSEFRNIVSRNQAAVTERMALFFADYRNCLSSFSSAGQFSLLDVTGVGNDEVKHSSILAWLLTPDAPHGCGTRFLHLFLKAANVSIPQEHLSDSYVRTEFSGNESIIDILICKPGRFLVYVENKTVSAEGLHQIDREYRDMVHVAASLRVPLDQMFPVFLTPGGRPPTSGNARPWLPVSYSDVAREFLTALPGLQGRKVAFLVEDLIRQYKRWGGI